VNRFVGAVLCASVLSCLSCDTTQPSGVTEETAQVFLGAQATVALYDVYEVWVDTNNDNTPDVPTGESSCRPVFEGTSPKTAGRAVPWRFAARVRILRAGSTEPETIANFDSVDPFSSVAPYDEIVETAAGAAPEPPRFFLAGRRVSVASRLYMERCTSQTDLPDPNLSNQPLPFPIRLEKGDTLIVEARKEPDALHGALPPKFPVVSPPILSGRLLVGGQPVAVQGTTVSTAESGSGVAFSFTLR